VAAIEAALDEAAARICASLRGKQFGSIRVVAAECRVEAAPDGSARVYFDLTLADPAGTEETWPVDDLLRLQASVDEKAAQSELAAPWEVSVRRESPEDYDEDPSSEG
jgi:hypothetical protein